MRGVRTSHGGSRLRHFRRAVVSHLKRPIREGPRRYVWRIAVAYFAACVIAWPFLYGLGDRWWPATLLLFGPRWVLLLPLLVLVPAALTLLPRALVLLGAGALVVAGPVMGFAFDWRPGRARADADFRIVTLNMQGGLGLGSAEAIGTAMSSWRADIVVLQECPLAAAELATLTPLATHARDGLCLVTRFPIEAIDSLPVWRIGQLGQSGSVARYDLTIGGRSLHLTNLHLDTPGRGLEMVRERADPELLASNIEVREIAARRAANWVTAAGSPALVAGDFNMPVESAIFRRYWSHFDDAFARAGRGYGGTRVLRWFRARIDHVLSTPELAAVRATVGEDVGSDHLPLIVDYAWNHDD